VPEVWIPPLLRRFAREQTRVKVSGRTLRQVIDSLEREYPGIKEHLCADDEIMPGIAVAWYISAGLLWWLLQSMEPEKSQAIQSKGMDT